MNQEQQAEHFLEVLQFFEENLDLLEGGMEGFEESKDYEESPFDSSLE